MDGVYAPAPAFRYADVPAEHREWLRVQADQITSLAYRTVCDLVRQGQQLAEARARLRSTRTFRRWVAAELPFSRSWAYHLIKIAQAFAEHVRPDAREVIDAKALVILAAAPPGARAFALEQAADGRRVTAADAREIVAAHKPIPDRDRDAEKAHEQNMRPVREAEKRDRQAADPPADDLARKARAFDMILALAGLDGAGVYLSRVKDEEDDGEAPYYVSVMTPIERRAATRRALADAIAAVLDEEERRKCLGPCKQFKALGEFGENRLKRGGKNPYCKACERARLGNLKRAAKAAARARREAERAAS